MLAAEIGGAWRRRGCSLGRFMKSWERDRQKAKARNQGELIFMSGLGAINEPGGFGVWHGVVSKDPADVKYLPEYDAGRCQGEDLVAVTANGRR